MSSKVGKFVKQKANFLSFPIQIKMIHIDHIGYIGTCGIMYLQIINCFFININVWQKY